MRSEELHNAIDWLASIDVHSEAEASDKELILSTLEKMNKGMSEEEYIQLQTLLAKFRVEAMKEYGSKETPVKVREHDLKIIRRIDYLRNNTILKIYEDNL